MSDGPKKFTKKPVTIEAWQLSEDNGSDVAKWCGGRFGEATALSYEDRFWRLQIPTLEGVMDGTIGDWIIKGVAGEFYPCKPGIFYETYEPASDE